MLQVCLCGHARTLIHGYAPSKTQAWQVKFCELCLAMAMAIAFKAPSAARKHLRNEHWFLRTRCTRRRRPLTCIWDRPKKDRCNQHTQCSNVTQVVDVIRPDVKISRAASSIGKAAYLNAPLAATLTVLGLISVPLPCSELKRT